jgi:hypothetical protein
VRSSKSLYHARASPTQNLTRSLSAAACDSLSGGNKGLCRAAAAAHLRPARLLLAKKQFACGRNQDNECADVKFCHSRAPPEADTSRSLCRRLPHQFPAADEPLIPPFTREERADFNFRPLCEQKYTSEGTVNAFFLWVAQFAYFNIHERRSGNWLKTGSPFETQNDHESHFGPN